MGTFFSAQRMNWPKYYGAWPDSGACQHPIAAEAFNPRAFREGSQGFLATQMQLAVDVTNMVQANDIAPLRVQWHLTDRNAKPLAIVRTTSEVVRRQSDGRWLDNIDRSYGCD